MIFIAIHDRSLKFKLILQYLTIQPTVTFSREETSLKKKYVWVHSLEHDLSPLLLPIYRTYPFHPPHQMLIYHHQGMETCKHKNVLKASIPRPTAFL